MIDAATERLQAMQSSELARIEKQVEEADQKKAEDLRRRDERRRQQLEAIDRSRAAQVEMRRKQREQEEHESKEFARRVQQALIGEEERAEYEQFLLQQADEKEIEKECERHGELYDTLKQQEAARREDDRFDQEVKSTLRQYEEEGKDTVMIQRCRGPVDEVKLAALAM